MNKKLLGVLSLVLLVSMLPACGKKDNKKSDRRAYHHKNHEPKHRKAPRSYKKAEPVMVEEDEDMK